MKLFMPVSFSILVILCGCADVAATEFRSSICDLGLSDLDEGAQVRVRAVYSPSSMHGDVLRDEECPSERVKTYGYEDAAGGVSEQFKREIDRNLMGISEVEFAIDVTGVIEIDADGIWLRVLTVHSYSTRLKKTGPILPGSSKRTVPLVQAPPVMAPTLGLVSQQR